MSDATPPAAKPSAPIRKQGLSALLPGKETITCRHCGSTDVRPSHKATGRSDYVVYRCRACKHHFKVVSNRPRIHAIISVFVFLLVVLGVGISFFMSATSDDEGLEYLPRVDMADKKTLPQAQVDVKKGDSQSQYEFGKAYWHREDYVNALPWLKAAADQGHVEAQYLLGMAYLQGRGTVQNYRTALEQFTKAADRGHIDAEYELGLIYRDGLSVPRDRETAYVWLNLAAAQGHAEALALRERLSMAMTGDEIVRAQDTSAQLHKKMIGLDLAEGKPQ